ncbi:MAG: hypothetical protein E7376_02550 [Clostridiales bacterium]|nr:hypothetical protein [Clostridiales bacterium]
MYIIKENEILIISTKTETFTFYKSNKGICNICIERYNKPFPKLDKDEKKAVCFSSESGYLTPSIQEQPNNCFSLELQAQNQKKYLKVQLNEGQLVAFPVFNELECSK